MRACVPPSSFLTPDRPCDSQQLALQLFLMSGSAACRAYCSTRSLCRWRISTPTRLHPLLSLANSRHGTATRDTWLKALVTSCPAYSSSPYANPNRPRLEIALAFAPMPVLRSTGCWSCVSVGAAPRLGCGLAPVAWSATPRPPDRQFQAAQTAGQLRTIGAGEHAFAMMLIVAQRTCTMTFK